MLRAATLTGSVKLPDTEMIPPSATVHVELRDVSKSDAGAMLIGKIEIHGGGKNEAPFEILYDDKKIVAEHSYSVSCRVIAKGKLLFVNNSQIAVITHGAPAKDVVLPVDKVKR
jgi:uncharacterized lipoprotein YbaY